MGEGGNSTHRSLSKNGLRRGGNSTAEPQAGRTVLGITEELSEGKKMVDRADGRESGD